ncbi:MAG: hypothetical protein H7144_10360 [Burkholderiales bacterium]|nr:hypothetical protein [Phycisphaerae bacterium]
MSHLIIPRRQAFVHVRAVRALAVSLLFGAVAAGQVPALSAPAPSIDEVIASVEAAERRLVNIHVTGTATLNESADGREWKQTPGSCVVKAWMNALIDGPFRVDVSSEVIKWADAPAGKPPYFESSYAIAYDGRQITRLQKTVGSPGHMKPVRVAEISADVQSMRVSPSCRLANGSAFAINFWSPDTSQTLSEYLRHWIDQQSRHPELQPIAIVEWSRADASREVMVIVGYRGKIEHAWRLDPTRGWAVVGYELRQGESRSLVNRYLVNKLEKVADDLWYPAEADLIQPPPFSGTVDTHTRWRYSASEIVANRPETEQAITSMSLPAGTQVTDKAQNRMYEVAAPDNQTSRAIDALLLSAVRAATQPSSNAGAD